MLITDPADPRLDDIRNLNKSDKSGEGLVIAEGPLVVSRLAESRFPMRCLVGFPKKVEAYFSEYGEPECPIYEVSRETLAEVAGFDMHRGLVAAADRAPEPEVGEILETAKTIAVLEAWAIMKISAPSSGTPPAWAWMRCCWAPVRRIRSIVARCACPWGTCCACLLPI